MPSEDELFADLERFLAIYRNTVEARDRILATRPGEFHTASRARNIAEAAEPDPEPLFRPKDSGEYLASVRAQRQRRTRRHEDLVRQFGEHVRGQGWTAATNVHPRDLVLRHGASEFLVEAEVVRNNAQHAVREAIGQLFSYRHFWYRERQTPDPVLERPSS